MKKGFRVLTREEAAKVFAKGGDSGGSSPSSSSGNSSSTSGGKSGGGDSSSSSGGAGSTSFTYTPPSGGSGIAAVPKPLPPPTIPPVITPKKPDGISPTGIISIPETPISIPTGFEITQGTVTVSATIDNVYPPTVTVGGKITF